MKRQKGKRKEQHVENAARQIFTATLSPAAFRDPSIALSCRVRARERPTKKDQGCFIRTRAARVRILRVGAYQASCGGQTFFKSRFSPVQLNYQPLLESISAHSRENWDAVRHASMIRARGGSLNMAHSVSSNGRISEGDGGVRNHEPLEGLSHEQHVNEFNSAQDDVDGGHGKREGEIETEKYGEVLQLSSGNSPDATRTLRKFKEFQRFECRPHRKQRERAEEWSSRIERSIASAR